MKAWMAVAAVLTLQAGAAGWRGSTGAGLTLTEARDTLRIVNTGGGSVDLWRGDARPMTGAYAVRATLAKQAGRQHEGYGVLFGGRHLGTDSAQYSYVLIRGDGAVLIKKRTGAATPVVRDWQAAQAVRQDDAQHRASNQLEVRVTATEVIALVNGTEVARVPSRDLYTAGVAGVRVSHQMQVDVIGFSAAR